MIWPLMILSVVSMAVILERIVYYITHKIPFNTAFHDHEGLNAENIESVSLELVSNSAFAPFFKALQGTASLKNKDIHIQQAGDDVLYGFSRRLDFLSTVATCAPLIGLLGTVLGMIDAFSHLSSSGSADITMLAGGIWQALLTTATGLGIAIPVLLAHRWFCRQYDKIAFALQRTAALYAEAEPEHAGEGQP